MMAVLGKRMQRYGLTPPSGQDSPDPFRAPERGQRRGKGPATFDFLGFTLYWRRTRSGRWRLGCKTRRARLGRAIRAVYDWCRRHRHRPVAEQHAALVRRLQGHFNYFGVNGNHQSLGCLAYQARRAWYKWLRRRSQRVRLDLGKVPRPVTDLPLTDSSGGSNYLGVRTASRSTGRAGWWKSPCPDLARAWVGQPAQATRPGFIVPILLPERKK